MDEKAPSVDHSLWRYYQDGGKGFAARRAERLRAAPRMERKAEKETLARAVSQVKRQRMSGATPARPLRKERNRSADDAALDRARQALLGLILKDTAKGEPPSMPIDEKTVKAQVETMSPEALRTVAALFATVQAGGDGGPSGQTPVLQSLDGELAKRGISLQLSGKVNNVYLSGENAHWAVNASAGGDSESDRKPNNSPSAPRNRRYNNFGQALGRATRNFILGH